MLLLKNVFHETNFFFQYMLNYEFIPCFLKKNYKMIFWRHKWSTSASKSQIPKVGFSNTINDALYYRRFVDLFLLVKSARLKDFIFFVGRREKYSYPSN